MACKSLTTQSTSNKIIFNRWSLRCAETLPSQFSPPIILSINSHHPQLGTKSQNSYTLRIYAYTQTRTHQRFTHTLNHIYYIHIHNKRKFLSIPSVPHACYPRLFNRYSGSDKMSSNENTYIPWNLPRRNCLLSRVRYRPRICVQFILLSLTFSLILLRTFGVSTTTQYDRPAQRGLPDPIRISIQPSSSTLTFHIYDQNPFAFASSHRNCYRYQHLRFPHTTALYAFLFHKAFTNHTGILGSLDSNHYSARIVCHRFSVI